jgi:hypothetical protein
MSETSQQDWRRFGYDAEYIRGALRNLVQEADEIWHGPPTDRSKVNGWAHEVTCWGTIVLALTFMQYKGLAAPFDDWREVARRGASAAIYFFFGQWRQRFRWLAKTIDRAEARAELPWSDIYRAGMALAAAVHDWQTADALLQWPDNDLRFDEGTDDRTPQDNAYQIWLASRLRGDPPAAAAEQRDRVERGGRRRPKMLLEAADALLAGDSAALTKALSMYLKHYKQREMRPNRIDFGVCLDATVLWHWGCRLEVGDIPLPEEVAPLIPGR